MTTLDTSSLTAAISAAGDLPLHHLPSPDPSGRTVVAICCTVPESLDLYSRSIPWLSPDEQSRAACFRFDRDRCVYTAAHLLLRRGLHQATGRADWIFHKNASGKPELSEAFEGTPLRFNITHTAGLAACVLAYGHEVGIDAESLDRRGDHLQLARQFFTPKELEMLTQLSPDSREETFLAIWTAKEAVIKAAGHGLGMSLDTFSVDLSAPGVTFHGDGYEDPDRWSLHCHRLPRHHLAVAVRADQTISPPEPVRWFHLTWADLLNA